ncbi:antitoxin [Pseudonocardiaceae bacterium YIM PH 21723]|nr:antitoxin [Pseudonocardiaceae bacterium YIM PH 21723]
MATIQIRDVPDDVAATYRTRADLAGQSLQVFMREFLIRGARRRTKAEIFAAMDRSMEASGSRGISDETIAEALREARGE